MANEVHFYDLPANQQHKCDTMLSNKMQCPTRAAIAIVPDSDDSTRGRSYLCRNHFTVERVLNEHEGVKYIYHDSTGEVVSDVDKEYVPSQK